MIIKLLQNIGSRSEVEQYLKFYSAIDAPKFAVIKVGGGIIQDELDTLASSLSFLADVGLLPVVIHGAGPQLNDALKRQGVTSDYIGGMRITTPDILRTARQVFHDANLKIVKALEDKGTRARPIVSGVFAAEFLDQPRYQYVGQITGVDTSAVHHALQSGSVPVLTCMGESASGQRLNINADVAAQELAKALKPVKIIYLSQNGGIGDEHDRLMPVIDLDTDYERLMVQPWFRHGNRLKLKEIKTLLDQLPMSSSVAITSAANLPKELFTPPRQRHAGQAQRAHPVLHVAERDRPREADGAHRDVLRRPPVASLPRRTQAQHPPHLPLRVVPRHRHHHQGPQRPARRALPRQVRRRQELPERGHGAGAVVRCCAVRSLRCTGAAGATTLSTPGTSSAATAGVVSEPWIIFWYGLQEGGRGGGGASMQLIADCIEKARKPSRAASTGRSRSSHRQRRTAQTRSRSSHRRLRTARPPPTAASSSPLVLLLCSITSNAHSAAASRRHRQLPTTASSRFFHTLPRGGRPAGRRGSSTSAAGGKGGRVGLIGARGHTGGELISLIASHPHLSVTVASSRALKGSSRCLEVFPRLPPATAPWSSTRLHRPAA